MSSLDDILLSAGLYDEMFKRWEDNPSSVDPAWSKIFQNMNKGPSPLIRGVHPELLPPDRLEESHILNNEIFKLKIANYVNAWRRWGHLAADTNPLEKPLPLPDDRLRLETYGLSESDLNRICPTLGLLPKDEAPLIELDRRLQSIYANKTGIEYMDFTTLEIEKWFQSKLEREGYPREVSLEEKQMILEQLSKSELFETFMHTKYVGQKRFSLEGSETFIPMMEEAVVEGSDKGIEEFVIGMAHRGRLNVLSNILNKSFKEIFSEFDESYIPEAFEGTGDVKYHKGFESRRKTRHGKEVKLTLSHNPSHLESIDAVVEGQVKGKSHNKNLTDPKIMAILVHGDAALAGQGVVYETLQMQALEGFATGGTLHFVINNQIGFTTPPSEARSTRYCTDIAKSFGCPVLHVNVEDPEGCVAAVRLAIEFRMRFQRDIFIDLLCYRKYGHNESDEPAFTQPHLYQSIKERKPVRIIYRQKLIHSGTLEAVIAESIETEFKRALNDAKEGLKLIESAVAKNPTRTVPPPEKVTTAFDFSLLLELGVKLAAFPETLHLHPKILNLIKDRQAMMSGGDKRVDWGMGETLAYGSLLWEGISIRLSGQDVERGTFSHRHAVWVGQNQDDRWVALSNLHDKQGKFYIYNTLLSEYAALAFEYGYSLSTPSGLTIWEAQFGDFSNGAQVVIDQYLASAEQKWGQSSGLTMFLPHGYEGQGPEHSSARMERYLALSANENLRICCPSTPAQHFHLLRRQALLKAKKPLIVFTPKALLRLPACTSPIEDFSRGEFQEVIDDPNPPLNPKKIVFCTGKIYYDLQAYSDKIKDESTVFIRIEQLYPLSERKIREAVLRYENVREVVWVQEEPKNMGAWSYIATHLERIVGKKIRYIGRNSSASPAAGIYVFHKKEVQDIMEEVFSKDQPTTFEISGQFRA